MIVLGLPGSKTEVPSKRTKSHLPMPSLIPTAKNTSSLPFYFWAKGLLPLKHGNNEFPPLFLNVIWMITLQEFDTSKFYPNLEKTKKILNEARI